MATQKREQKAPEPIQVNVMMKGQDAVDFDEYRASEYFTTNSQAGYKLLKTALEAWKAERHAATAAG
jgi:hypothetical protein